jgi:hypothetical protein
MLDPETARSNEIVRICSMCKKIAISQREWVEIEERVAKLRLFEEDAMPQ